MSIETGKFSLENLANGWRGSKWDALGPYDEKLQLSVDIRKGPIHNSRKIWYGLFVSRLGANQDPKCEKKLWINIIEDLDGNALSAKVNPYNETKKDMLGYALNIFYQLCPDNFETNLDIKCFSDKDEKNLYKTIRVKIKKEKSIDISF